MKMKIIIVLLPIAYILSLLAGCGNTSQTATDSPQTATDEAICKFEGAHFTTTGTKSQLNFTCNVYHESKLNASHIHREIQRCENLPDANRASLDRALGVAPGASCSVFVKAEVESDIKACKKEVQEQCK